MSRYLDLSQNCVLYGDTMLPQEAFFTSDTAEMKLVTCVFEMAKSIAELKLTETELALYSACVLLSPGKRILYYDYLHSNCTNRWLNHIFICNVTTTFVIMHWTFFVLVIHNVSSSITCKRITAYGVRSRHSWTNWIIMKTLRVVQGSPTDMDARMKTSYEIGKMVLEGTGSKLWHDLTRKVVIPLRLPKFPFYIIYLLRRFISGTIV